MDEARTSADSLVSPRQVALTYDRVVSAHWRGETDTATAFDEWFEAHWSDQAPPEPDAPPEGTSVLGGSGAGIRWYARDEAVLGYVSSRPDGCYRVPMREALPALMASWDILELEAARQPGTDQLLDQQTGTSPLSAIGPDATAQRAQDSEGSATQEPAVPEMLVAVHILETSAAGNPSGVAAGS
jgi:hypothetical protein